MKLKVRLAVFAIALAVAGYFTLASPVKARADGPCSGNGKCQPGGEGGPILCCHADIVAK
jgi:hypothetical protein